PSGTPTGISTGLGATFTSNTAGNFIFSESTPGAGSNSDRYLPVHGYLNGVALASEGTVQEVAPMAFNMTDIYVSTTDPGGTTSRIFTLRKNASNTALACTVAHGSTTCHGTGTIAISTGDLLDFSNVQSGGTATTGRSFVGFIGNYVAPSGN